MQTYLAFIIFLLFLLATEISEPESEEESEESDGESDTSESPGTLHTIIHLPFVSPARYPNKKNLGITYFCCLTLIAPSI